MATKTKSQIVATDTMVAKLNNYLARLAKETTPRFKTNNKEDRRPSVIFKAAEKAVEAYAGIVDELKERGEYLSVELEDMDALDDDNNLVTIPNGTYNVIHGGMPRKIISHFSGDEVDLPATFILVKDAETVPEFDD